MADTFVSFRLSHVMLAIPTYFVIQAAADVAAIDIVEDQPTIAMTTSIRGGAVGDRVLTFSVLMAALCCIVGGWWNVPFNMCAVATACAVSTPLKA